MFLFCVFLLLNWGWRVGGGCVLEFFVGVEMLVGGLGSYLKMLFENVSCVNYLNFFFICL